MNVSMYPIPIGMLASDRQTRDAARAKSAGVELTPAFVDKALAHDEEAKNALDGALLPAVQRRVALELYRWKGHARGRDPQQELEDMTQQVFVSLFEADGRALRAWTPARGLTLSDFVEVLCARQVVSVLRSGRRSPWKEDTVDDEVMKGYAGADRGPEAAASARNLGEALLERLRDELSPKGIELFERLFVLEQEAADVAAAQGLSLEAVYQWRSRIVKLARGIAHELQSEKAGTS